MPSSFPPAPKFKAGDEVLCRSLMSFGRMKICDFGITFYKGEWNYILSAWMGIPAKESDLIGPALVKKL